MKKVKENNRLKHKKKIIIIAVILIIIIFFLGFFLNQNQKVYVTNVIGMTSDKAYDKLSKLDLKVEIKEVENDDEEIGKVYDQNIYDKKVKPGTKIILNVYVSSEKVKVPDVIGMQKEEAKEILIKLGFNVSLDKMKTTDFEDNIIIKQEAANPEKIVRGSIILLTYSQKVIDEKEKETPAAEENKDTNNKNNNSSTNNSTSDKNTNNNNTNSNSSSNNSTSDKNTNNNNANSNTSNNNNTNNNGTNNNTSSNSSTNSGTSTNNNSWSPWGTSLPSSVTASKYDIETKTQYSSRTKEYTESTSSSLSGWTKYDTKTETVSSEIKTVEGGAKIINQYKNNPNYEIISQECTIVHYYRYYCEMNSNGQYLYQLPTTDLTCPSGYTLGRLAFNAIYSYINESKENTTSTTYVRDQLVSVLIKDIEQTEWKLTYREKQGTITKYYYYRWSSWSSYQDQPINKSSEVEVRTRTMYRYRKK